MYLKSIELIGFKSFASKMNFKFEKGMTAIVGPNGSGKSNVADAVRWVLGEQSAKQLRGSKMEDVIFSGTETRKPHGYCQVDLTIDNQDMKMPIEYSEVTVSRRVYRSGEGEYFINGTGCRLKDVHELFMDTGVGKEGYSIIGQGQIDKILSTKPDDRRALFDEAAGIVKFKNRKTSAEKILEKERQNLLRINDIIIELESQKEILEEQSAKAKIYLEKKEELKKYDLNIFVQETRSLTEQIGKIEEKEKTVGEQIEEALSSHEASKLRHSDINKELEEMETAIEVIRNRITGLKSEKERKESAIALIKEQMAHLSSNHIRALDRIKTLEEKKQAAEEELGDLAKQLTDHEAAAESDSEALRIGNEKLAALNKTADDLEEVMNALRSDMIEQLNSMSNDKSKVNRLEASIEHNAARVQAVKGQIAKADRQLEEDSAVAESLLTGLEEKKTALATAVEEMEKARHKGEELEGRIKKLESSIRDFNFKRHNEESKASAIAAVEEEYEGYQYSIKQVMQLRKNKPGYDNRIHGVVADVIRTDKRYEKAIETALGGAYQHIITDSEETAKDLIGYLKTNRYGRATFLPLTTIKGRSGRPIADTSQNGFLGFADNLVETEGKYSEILSNLLGNIVIVDNLDNGLKIAKGARFKVRIVTLEGDVINPGGAMTGGAYKNDKNSFLSRKRELEEHMERAAVLAREIGNHEQQLATAKKEYEGLAASLKAMAEEIRVKREDIQKDSLHYDEIEKSLSKARIGKKDLAEELEVLEGTLAEQRGDLKVTGDKLENYDTNKGASEKRIEDISMNLIDLKDEKEQLLEELTGLRVRSSASEERKRHAESLITRMKEEIEGFTGDIDSLKREITDGNTSYGQKEREIKAHSDGITVMNEEITRLETEFSGNMGKRQTKQKEQETLYEQREEESTRIGLLEKEMSRLENQKVKFDVQKENLLDYMWNEYEMTYNQAHKYLDESLGALSTVKQKIGKLKGEIKELGDVNVNAIEDFKQVSERYSFLAVQRDDVVRAEAKLRQVINDLDVSMQQQFRERFREINTEFGFMFKELFGGGKAMLELTDTENVLEAGVQIIAQPPGKKLQNMMLLSGGERAFTAIALLFAIQSLKPSPFCVLDEIDAALDDANVDRFAKYLLKLSKNTQFIIITHKHGTMEAADALYGITMQEKGISTQVSVKLIEDEI